MYGTLSALLAMFILCPVVAFISSARGMKKTSRLRRPYRWRA